MDAYRFCVKRTLKSPEMGNSNQVAKEPEPVIRHVLIAEIFGTKAERHYLLTRVFFLPSLVFRANKCGSSMYPFISFSLGYSAFPPSAFQKMSGSLPSLTDVGCHVGCIQDQEG